MFNALPAQRSRSRSVSTVGAYLVPSYRPAVQGQLLTNLKNSNGSNVLSAAQIAAFTNTVAIDHANYVALPVTTWRPFGLGGGALDGDVDNQDNRSQQFTRQRSTSPATSASSSAAPGIGTRRSPTAGATTT